MTALGFQTGGDMGRARTPFGPPEVEMAKHLLIGVHFQWVRTVSKHSGSADIADATDSTYHPLPCWGLHPAYMVCPTPVCKRTHKNVRT